MNVPRRANHCFEHGLRVRQGEGAARTEFASRRRCAWSTSFIPVLTAKLAIDFSVSRLPVIIFPLMLDRQNRDRIQRRFKPVKRKEAAGAEFDHQFAQVFATLDWSTNHRRMSERHE